MCGFAGIFNPNNIDVAYKQRLEDKIAAIAHRGPDDQGNFEHECLSLKHVRLAIIDPQPRSAQPMTSHCNRYVLAFNGEIYNYKELRKELIHRGFQFHTDGDTEVLLYHLQIFGSAGIEQLEGCFSFVFCDLQSRSILLARDAMGINPLWFTFEGDNLIFGSELKGLPYLDAREYNPIAIRHFLRFTYNPLVESALKGVFQLPPGHFIEFPNKRSPQAWFQLNETFNKASMTKPLDQILEQAVVDRLVADVPLGCFLSGGIDSSIVSALAARHHSDLNTFSIGFENHRQIDETDAGIAVARHIGSHHHVFEMSDNDLVISAEGFLTSIDEPFADASGIAVYHLAKHTSKHVKVALSGDGADELFGGYRKHRAHALAAGIPRGLWKIGDAVASPFYKFFRSNDRMRSVNRFISGAAFTPDQRYLHWASFTDKAIVNELFVALMDNDDNIYQELSGKDELNQILYNDQRIVLPGDMLTKVDLMTMRHALEVRAPFLAKDVVKFANALPSSAKFDRHGGKYPLRKAFSHLLPEEVFTRKKQGFEIPLTWLLKHGVSDRVERLSQSVQLDGIGLRLESIAEQVNAFRKGNNRLSTLIWCLVVLDAWLQRNLAGKSD